MKQRLPAGCAVLLGLLACGGKATDPDTVQSTANRPEPVVVYAAHDDPNWWPGVFSGFTRETGIRVSVRHRDAATIVNEVIRNHGSPPADVLLTPSVSGAWMAAAEGGLRPLQSDVVPSRVDDTLRDPDGYWVAVRTRTAVIAHAPDFEGAAGVTGLSALGEPAYRGQLCLTSSSLPLNRVVIATLIDLHGAREAELAVRSWVRNLSLPPFDDEASLQVAIADGTCRLGVLSSDAAGGLATVAGISDEPPVVDIDAIGIARHAREPESARQLIEWLLQSDAVGPTTIGGQRPLARVAWRVEDAIKLAERAGYD